MNLHLDYPIDIGREWRYKTIDNFKMLSNFYQDITSNMKYHRTEEKHAHHARQIDYENVSVETFLNYLNAKVRKLVIGHNGDGINELKDSRVAVDGTPFNVLSDRLFYDFTRIEKKLDENYEKLNKKIERIVNVNDYGADPTGENKF